MYLLYRALGALVPYLVGTLGVRGWTVFQLVSFFHDAQIVTATPVAIFAQASLQETVETVWTVGA